MTRLQRVLALLVVLAPAAAFRQRQARPLAIEDYYRIQTAGNPAISPDGKWVVFTLSTRIEEDNGTRIEAYVVPADASAKPRRVLHYGRDVSNPRWNEDGALEFTVERQRWKIDPADSAARPVRTESLLAGAVLSRDRKWLALTKDRPSAKK